MKAIPLRGKKAAGRVVLVDDEDYELVKDYKWNVKERVCKDGRIEACAAASYYEDGKTKTVRMNKLITGFKLTDHADGNGLNNQRYNLREANVAQNQANSYPKGAASGFKGVRWDDRSQKWRAYIKVDGKQINLGFFVNKVNAAKAYDTAAREKFGEFAKTNFPVNSCWCCGQECMFCYSGEPCHPEHPHWCAECKYVGCRMCCGCNECRRLQRAGWSPPGTPSDQRLPHLTPGGRNRLLNDKPECDS